MACPACNAQGNRAVSASSYARATSGGTSTQRSGELAVAKSRTCSSLPHTRYTSPSYLRRLASSTSVGNQPIQRWSDERPVLGYVGRSPHGYCAFTGLTKPWPIMQSRAAGLGGVVFVVAVVAMVTEYYGWRIIVLPAPCTWTVVLRWCRPSKQGRFTPTKGLPQTKGTTGDPVGHAHGLVCWTRQPFIYISNLVETYNSLTPSFPQLKLRYPDGVPMPED